MNEVISIGKIINFHGISGTARVGYSNLEVIKKLKEVIIENRYFNVEKINFHKNFALIKFKEINSIDELLPYKGKNIYIKKQEVQKALPDDEFLIDDLTGLNVFDDKEDFLGKIEEVQTSSGNDILCVKRENGTIVLIPFVKEIVPIVDIKTGKVIIKPIEGLI